jgi:hypothetical protein
MTIDLRNSEILHHAALSADEAHAPHLFDAAIAEVRARINEFADRDGLKFVIAVIRPKQTTPAATAPQAKLMPTAAPKAP